MSELIKNRADRLDQLFQYTRRLIDGHNGKALVDEYREYLDTVTAVDTMQILDRLLLEGYSTETVKKNVGKIINIFFKSLNSIKWNKPGEGHFLYYMMQENREVEKVMADLKQVIKQLFNEEKPDEATLLKRMQQLINLLSDYELHYIKKENILFPYIENAFPEYRCLKIMWSFHDDFRRSLKAIRSLLYSTAPDKALLNTELGKLFFVVLPIIFREEQIVFPVAIRALPAKAWEEMMLQSFETGWCYSVKPVQKESIPELFSNENGLVNLSTGYLNAEQLILMLDNLPVDVTFVDENDEVRYFSGMKHRIFPRSKAIIGRKVQNCHPPESVHLVNEIVDSFKKGSKSHAEFWIQMKGRFIHIRYFALRNDKEEYKGTIEVSQDVTEIRNLKGEKRLLDWNQDYQENE